MNGKLGVIIQARMASSRFPGKILKNIGNKVLLGHILCKLSFLKHNAEIFVATTNTSKDDVVERFCDKNTVVCFRGSESNVLERYYFCAKKYKLKHIIRLTGDNPFVDVEEIDNLIDLYFKTKSDFSNSFKALPVGVGSEIFSFSALRKSYSEAKESHHIEHVDEYMLENPNIFKTTELTVSRDKNRHDVQLTVDTEEDYRKACYIVENALEEFISISNAIRLSEEFLKVESNRS